MSISFYSGAVSGAELERLGFRSGARGTHTSRTMMLAELRAVLDECPPESDRARYAEAIIDGNCLGKATAATRRLSNQRLGELYALDTGVPLFRVLRKVWQADPAGRPLIALACAIARDPLLAATANAVLPLSHGDALPRDSLTSALRAIVGTRLNDSTLDKVVRNAGSSWSQAGHLEGRTFKRRRTVQPTAGSVAYSLYLAFRCGFRGEKLFSSGWILLLDCSASLARELALEAKRQGLIDLRVAGDVVEINFTRLDPAGVEG